MLKRDGVNIWLSRKNIPFLPEMSDPILNGTSGQCFCAKAFESSSTVISAAAMKNLSCPDHFPFSAVIAKRKASAPESSCTYLGPFILAHQRYCGDQKWTNLPPQIIFSVVRIVSMSMSASGDGPVKAETGNPERRVSANDSICLGFTDPRYKLGQRTQNRRIRAKLDSQLGKTVRFIWSAQKEAWIITVMEKTVV